MATSQEKALAQYRNEEPKEEHSLFTEILTTFGFYVLKFLCLFNYCLDRIWCKNHHQRRRIYTMQEYLAVAYIVRRGNDILNMPICSPASNIIKAMERKTLDNGWTYKITGKSKECINMSSYNFLGLEREKTSLHENPSGAIRKYGISYNSPINEYGYNPLMKQLEDTTARFLGVEDVMVFGMGFATNALNIPCLVTNDCLVLSDEENHASIVTGLRISAAKVKIFKNNDMNDLERIVIDSIVEGQPETGLPWKKILVIVEGIYSMNGCIVNLPELIKLKRKYKLYIHIDEAHSIGSIGPRGRGVTDYFGCDPRDVDILMGTFSKAMGSFGGYIGGSKNTIKYLRANSQTSCYASAMPPPVAQHAINSLKIIMGEDGTCLGETLRKQLLFNTRYFRERLKQMGIIVHGNLDSPVVLLMTYSVSKTVALVRSLRDENIAVPLMAYPMLKYGRVRFCMSATLTREEIDKVLTAIEKSSTHLNLAYSRKTKK